MATNATPRGKATLLAILLLALASSVLPEGRVDGDVFVYPGPWSAEDEHAGDFYIVNNTDATISLPGSPAIAGKAFSNTTIAPWGVLANTNVSINESYKDSNLTINIQAQQNVPACSVQVSFSGTSDDVYWKVVPDASFQPITATPAKSSSGALAFTYIQWSPVDQTYNANYVVTLVAGPGIDKSPDTGTKVLLVISRNFSANYYQYGLGFTTW